MRVLALAVLLLAGCTGGPAASSRSGSAEVVEASRAPEPVSPTTPPTVAPAASPVANGVYTASDEEIAKRITAGTHQVVPQLELLNDMSPDMLEDLFIPLGLWITAQKTTVEAYSPSGCTAEAVALFLDGMDEYDTIRKTFLAWRDWGANGHAFPPGAPRKAVTLFDEAVVELEAHCASDR